MGSRRIPPEVWDEVGGLYRAEAARLLGYACTVPGVSRSDADDLVQMTFQDAAIAWERQLSLLDHEARRRWLFRVLRNKAIDQWRAFGSRLVLSDRVDDLTGCREDPYSRAADSAVLRSC